MIMYVYLGRINSSARDSWWWFLHHRPINQSLKIFWRCISAGQTGFAWFCLIWASSRWPYRCHWSVPGGLGCCHCHPRCFCRGSAKTWGAATKSPAQMARANQVLGPLLVYRSIACLCKQPVEPTASSRCSWPLWNIYEHFGFSTASPCLV
jgi:hypothetical protein